MLRFGVTIKSIKNDQFCRVWIIWGKNWEEIAPKCLPVAMLTQWSTIKREYRECVPEVITEPEWTSAAVCDFCRNRSRIWSQKFKSKPDPYPEQELILQFLLEPDNSFQ